MGSNVVCIVAAAAITLPPMTADPSVVLLKCTITPEWIAQRIALSTNVPKPTRQQFIDVAKENGMYEIDASFTDDSRSGGVGTFFGAKTEYTKDERTVSYDLPDFGSALLDSTHGTMQLSVTRAGRIDYGCVRQPKPF